MRHVKLAAVVGVLALALGAVSVLQAQQPQVKVVGVAPPPDMVNFQPRPSSSFALTRLMTTFGANA